MRLKLLLVVSLVGAAIGSSASIVGIIAFESYWARLLGVHSWDRWASALIFVFIPWLGGAMLASVFIYRHTARRRKTQAVLTAMLVLLLCCLALGAVSRFFFQLHLSY